MTFRELFEVGSCFEAFLNKDQDINREKTLEIYNSITLEEELVHRIKEIGAVIKILVFAEIWCPDCVINVPALQKIKEINPNIEFRILPREGNEIYMEPYKVGGKTKIPTFIVLDNDYKEKGAFLEIPKTLKEVVGKGNQVEIIVAKRKYKKGEYISSTIEEILDIINRK
ncbi:Thioredoxin [Anaerovirgula multivorans]|uniref:Thioredoxin n=1 Tax=Anaerovirgula multivorans TaxID=312168 RepID=A0A239E0X4_9FIRM|nr:thioredoxin family protein [Anaerovirgula multivorans]SNS38149.1 Thioredoxin [Anaerovirgula multivorans]